MPETQPIVVLDRFPARLLALPGWDGPLPQQARVILTRERLYVYVTVDSPAFTSPVDLEHVTRRGTFDPPGTPERADTADGRVEWQAGSGCGCGNPLKSMRLAAAIRSGPMS